MNKDLIDCDGTISDKYRVHRRGGGRCDGFVTSIPSSTDLGPDILSADVTVSVAQIGQ